MGCIVVSSEELDWLSSEAAALYDHSLVVSEGGAAVYLERAGEACGLNIAEGPAGRLYSLEESHEETLRSVIEKTGPADASCTGVTGSTRTDYLEIALNSKLPGNKLEPLRRLGHGMSTATGWQVVAAVKALEAGPIASVSVATAGANQQAAAMLLRKTGDADS